MNAMRCVCGGQRLMMRLLVLAVLLTGGIAPAAAQLFDPVRWEWTVEEVSATEASLKFTAVIGAGWSMYAIDIPDATVRPIPTSFAFEPDAAFALAGAMEQVMKPEVAADPLFDGLLIGKFRDLAVFRQRIEFAQKEPFTVRGSLEFMCCDNARCLPPKQVTFAFRIVPPVPPARGNMPQAVPSAVPPVIEKVPQVQEDTPPVIEKVPDVIEQVPQVQGDVLPAPAEMPLPPADNSLWLFFIVAVLAGFGGVITPCVYPMIPFTVSFFMRAEERRSAGIAKALIFGFSIVLIYTLAGVIIALTKRADFVNVLVAHWVTNVVFAGVFIVFALWFFGVFEITIGGPLANRVDRLVDRGGYVSAFFMALALVLISFSCTGPVVGSILVASTQGLAIKPVLGMLGYGAAFALPFTLLAFFPSLVRRLPKSGGWMNAVKVVFAFVMLAFSLYFLALADRSLGLNIISRNVFLCIWITLFAMTGCYILGKIRFAHDVALPHVGVARVFFAAAAFTFALYLFTGLLGAPLRAVAGLLPVADDHPAAAASVSRAADGLCGVPKYSDHANLHWPYGLQGYFDYDEALACAHAKNKPVLMIFKGHACAKCREMEAIVWPDAEIMRLMSEEFVLLALYTDDTTPLPESEHVTSTFDGKVKTTMGQKNVDIEISRYHTNAFPYHVILNAEGQTINQPMGYTSNAREFEQWLRAGLVKR